MYQTIHEKIAVIGVYRSGQFLPRKFRWQGRDHYINEVTLISDVKDGGILQRFYSVAVGPNVYRLVFNRTAEQFFLEEVWCE